MADRPDLDFDLLSADVLEEARSSALADEGTYAAASEVLLAREVIALVERGELVWAWESEWCWRADEFSPLVPLSDVRPDLAAYLDALEATDG